MFGTKRYTYWPLALPKGITREGLSEIDPAMGQSLLLVIEVLVLFSLGL